MVVDEAQLDGLLLFNQILFGSFFAIGILFIFLGIFVYAAPVPCTVTGLVLYALGLIGTGILNPMSLVSGIIIKILIIAGLFKGVQSAIAYTKQENTV